MRQLLAQNKGRRLRATAEMARIAKNKPRHTPNIGSQRARRLRSGEFKRDVSNVRRTKVTRAAPKPALFDTRRAHALSLMLHAITLIAFAGIASFGLDFVFMIGQRWGFVIGVLLYLALYAACWNVDENEELPPMTMDEKQASQPVGGRRVFELHGGRSRGWLYRNS